MHRTPDNSLTIAARRRSAFSLVELMMGVIILGIGLLIIGAVLPIAWRSSLDTAALTRADAAADAAKILVESKALVDGPLDLFNTATAYSPLQPPDGQPDLGDRISYSFLGDFDTQFDLGGDGEVDFTQYVHALHLANWALEPGSGFTGFLNDGDAVPEAPILIDRLTWELSDLGADPALVGTPCFLNLSATLDPQQIVGAPVISFRDRVFPPIPAEFPAGSAQWRRILDGRKFAWAVLHRLVREPHSERDARYFMMYYVTLRRGESTNRYARQDHNAFPLSTSGARALGSDHDVMFPTAWRVPLVVQGPPPGFDPDLGGVPGVAYAGDLSVFDAGSLDITQHSIPANPNCNVTEMFPPGAYFVDDQNGIVYRVAEREYLDPDNRAARLTLDREVRDIDLGSGPDPTHRVVWAFPPPVVEKNRADGDKVTFSGFNPVVDIRVEPLTLMPHVPDDDPI